MTPEEKMAVDEITDLLMALGLSADDVDDREVAREITTAAWDKWAQATQRPVRENGVSKPNQPGPNTETTASYSENRP